MMLLAAACSDDGATSTTTQTGATTETGATTVDTSGVTLKIAVSTENSESLIREQSGVFEGTDYAIEWVEFNGSNATLEALNAGAIDLAVLQSPSAVLSVANAGGPWSEDDAPFHAIAAWDTPDTPGFQLLVNPGSGIETLADLAGKTVAFAKGAMGHYFWAAAARDAGLQPGDVEEAIMPAVDGRAAFLGGQVDALVTGNRTAVMLIGEGDATSIASSSDYVPYYTLTVARRGLLDDPARAAAVADYLARYAQMHVWMHDNAQQLADVMVQTFEMTPEDALTVAETESRVRVALADAADDLQRMADLFFEIGVADTEIDVTVLFDDRLDSSVGQQT